MPGWGWIFLVLFLLIMLVVGLVYVIRHALRSGKIIGRVGESVGAHMPGSKGDLTEPDQNQSGPFFARPLGEASERYSLAHAELLRRKGRKRLRHEETWARWEQFNQ